MMIMQPEGEDCLRKEPFLANEQIAKLIKAFHLQFGRMVRSHFFFHLFFIVLCGCELCLLIAFFSFLTIHSLLSFAFALLFLTAFSYFILKLYHQTRKPEQLRELMKLFSGAAKELLNYQEGMTECHLALADTFCRLAHHLSGQESLFYQPPRFFSSLKPFLERLSTWLHWSDVFNIKEMALLAAIEEHILLVKCDATSLETHTALANSYILLSELYKSASFQEEDDQLKKPSKLHSEELKNKFKMAAERAIEEFKILCNFSPNDPWVHEQLAYSYCELQKPLEAIAEYEIILRFNPNDPDILYKLGVLYFSLGRNAEGLEMYEQLKYAHSRKAEMLIAHYGAYTLAHSL